MRVASVIALGLLLQTAAAAQAPGGWDVVAVVPKGEKLDVELKIGGRVKGRLVTASATDLEISDGKKSTTVSQGDVLRIYQVVGRTRGKSSLRGAAIGGAIGVGIGLILYIPYREDFLGAIVPGFGAIGAGIGAGVGAAFSGGQKRVLIYQ